MVQYFTKHNFIANAQHSFLAKKVHLHAILLECQNDWSEMLHNNVLGIDIIYIDFQKAYLTLHVTINCCTNYLLVASLVNYCSG